MSAVRPPRAMETGRLLLRAPTEQDVDAIFEYASDPEVTAFMDWRRLSQRAEVLNFLSRTEAQWLSGIEFMWAITEKGASQVLGAISIRPRNARSIRVLEKLGLRREGLVPGGIVRPNLSPAPRDAYLYGRVGNAT